MDFIIGQKPGQAGAPPGAPAADAMIMDGDQKTFMKDVVEASRTRPGAGRFLGDLVRPLQAADADAGEGRARRRRPA